MNSIRPASFQYMPKLLEGFSLHYPNGGMVTFDKNGDPFVVVYSNGEKIYFQNGEVVDIRDATGKSIL